MTRPRPFWLAWTALGAVAMAVACSGGDQKLTGIGEPIVVAGAQFVSGPLPGKPVSTAPTAAAGASDAGASDAGPMLMASIPTFASIIVPAGESGKSFGGSVSRDSIAVGVRLAGMGSGYWVLPAGAPDPMAPTELSYSFKAGFDADIPAGMHDLLVVGIGASGAAGNQQGLPLCFQSVIPDNGHGCNPQKAPPAAVMSLHWDSNFDLDLHVILPDGEDVNPKDPFGNPLDGSIDAQPTIPPEIDRDSLRNCVPDGLRREDVVFQDPMPHGSYLVYVDPFAACGQPAARFTFTLYQSTGTCPDCQLTATESKSGELLASQVTGGASTGLFVDQLNVF
jgi:hypothetical protein